MRFARLAFVFLATTWVVLLVTAPGTTLGAPLSGITYALGSLLCHQRPERSFYAASAQVPVCARCCGLYLGAAVGGLVSMIRWSQRAIPKPATRASIRMILVGCSLPTAITWMLEAAGLWGPTNVTRFVAALPLGVAVALTVNYVECARPQRNESTLPSTPI